MMSQMGRRKSDNPKNEQVTVRLDKEHSEYSESVL